MFEDKMYIKKKGMIFLGWIEERNVGAVSTDIVEIEIPFEMKAMEQNI